MTTLVCPVCEARWKILPDGDGDRLTVCPVCANARSETPANAVDSGDKERGCGAVNAQPPTPGGTS
jgi:hypothetical protein